MTSPRIAAALVLLYSSVVFAQANPKKADPTSPSAIAGSNTPADWNAISGLAAKNSVPQDPLARLEASQPPEFKINNGHNTEVLFIPDPSQAFVMSPDSLSADSVCLKIRSYVMKRDGKNSDSTHLVGYSTCQPAKKFQLRTTVGSPEPQK